MQKSNSKTPPPPPATEDLYENDENQKARSRWDIWVAKNALPKNHFFPKPKCLATRFQKRGPMTETDWKRFIKWVNERSLPKRVFPQQKSQERPKKPPAKITRRGKLSRIPSTQEHKKKSKARLLRIKRLSVPKHQRGKYQAPPEPIYPFSPKIHFDKPPRHDRGRPFQPITLPFWWAHDELEMEFWRWMRFPISRRALKYRITRSTLRMAVPKKYPIKEHCSVPDRHFLPPGRGAKMTPKQWREHLRHLEYLADDSFKNSRKVHSECNPEVASQFDIMTRKQWQMHLERLKTLADASFKDSRKAHSECKPEVASQATKMSRKQWLRHLERLKTLADASFKDSRKVHSECKPEVPSQVK